MVAINMIQHTRLDSCSCQEHAHARVCPALTYSFHQCPGVMPSFIWGYGEKGPTSSLNLQGWKKPWASLWKQWKVVTTECQTFAKSCSIWILLPLVSLPVTLPSI